MACLQALQITEIVRMICDETSSHWLYSRLEYKTLLSLAITCKIFSEPALNLIWREQTSLVPLVKCMPETVWKERQVGAAVVVCLRRPIATSDLPRLLFYSLRVRRLDLDRFYTIDKKTVHPGFLKALDMSLPQGCFMPRLSHFSWHPQKAEGLTIMRHFLGAQIRELDLGLGDHIADLSILPFIRASCPLISELLLGLGGETNPHAIPLISEAVCGWQHLADLSIPNLDQASWTHIARLPSLTSLSVGFAKDTTLYLPEFLSGQPRFCTGIIQVISSTQFESLTISAMASWTTTAWQKLHTCIRDCLNNPAFHSIEVTEWAKLSRPVDIAPYVLSSAALRPLLTIRSLTSISYQIYPSLDVDDDFLGEMAKAWRRMEALQFGNEVAVVPTQRPRATLKCLINFAQYCRRLTNLGLPINATTDIPEFTQEPGKRICNHLEVFEVGFSPISSTKEAKVAAFISNLFPSLEYLFTCNSGPTPEAFGDHERSWRRVNDMIPEFISVRSQEKTFWRQELEDSDEEVV
ncbi:hypothetical protein K438DRAFT_1850115 [Mycena galopus ATCC 62051]|nr:hypothetical protein K438DRAFT_1850115 [Mycena galopus ATCC 62051]